ncbi:MAG: hypothetical protein JW955_17820 [Sedimentisphaerales bacterium]|nr:hypothetical protein [Sedimentisphaerales bacterium]
MIGGIISESLWLLLLVQGTACLAAGLATSHLIRHRAARAHQALLAAMLASVLMPSLYLLVRHFHLGVLASEAPLQPPDTIAVRVLDAAVPAGAVATESERDTIAPRVAELGVAVAPQETAAQRVPWRAVVLACWAAAAVLLLGRLILRFVLGLHLLHATDPLESEPLQRAVEAARARLAIRRPVRIRCSEKVRSPIIWCWAREATLLVHEAAAEREDGADWAGIFCHELAHVKRLDHISELFAEVLTASFPWHPLAWWTSRRLAKLSEQACDDWALAGGQIGVDYAESLLDLSPQRSTVVLPGIVGKEKAMKERIRRIVQDENGNPRVGVRWALAAGVLTALVSVGAAFAQRRPAELAPGEGQPPRPELRQERAERRLTMAGRRNVLTRLRDQLEEQARNTEAAIRERGGDMGEEGRVLRAELDTLREQIGIVERQLRDLERGPGDVERRANRIDRRRQPELEARSEDLRRRQDELIEQVRRAEQALRELGPDQEAQAPELKARLRELREQMGEVDRQLAEVRRAREEVRVGEARRPELEARSEDLKRHREELADQMRRAEQALQELTPEQDAEARELRARLQMLREQMADADRQLAELQRSQGEVERRVRQSAEPRAMMEPAQNRRLEAEVEDLRNEMRGLHEQMQQMQRVLEQVAERSRAGRGDERAERER